MKKFISLFCAVLLAVSCMLTASSSETVQDSYTIDYKYRVLSYLDIIKDNEMPSDSVSRGAFTVWAMRMLGYENEAQNYSGEIRFVDVPMSHYAGAYINTASQYGFVSGVGDGKFRPEEKIRTAEAISIVLNAAGWREYTVHKGKYPYSYLSVARELKLTDGIKADSEYMSVSDIMTLLYNSLSLHYLEASEFGSGSYTLSSEKSDTVLMRLKNSELYEGTVTADKYTSLTSGTGTGDSGMTEISGIVYYTDMPVKNLLAKNVVYIINKNEKTKLSFVTEKENKNTVKIASEDFDEIKNSTFYCYKNGARKAFSLKNGIPVIENGVFKGLYGTSAIKNSDLMFDSGYITFCDYDSDGKADALICEKFETVVLEHVSVPNMILYGKYADKRIELDSDNTETDFYITKDGKETDISSLAENNVLCVARADYNGGTLYNITVSDKKAKGTLESMTTDSKGKAYVTVNGASYRLSEDYYKDGTYAKNAEEIELGAEVTAYLNINGQVAYVEKAMEKEQKGYLTAVKPADKNFDSALLLKIFTPSGSFIYPVTAQKLYINGIKSSDPESDLSFSDTGGAKRCNQYIKYKLNTDGEVTEIKTQYGGFLCDIKSTVSHIHPPAAMVNHLYKINSDTVLFSIPENTEDDDEYKALSIDDTVNRDYKLSVYDADSEYNAGAVIIENYDSVMSEYIKSLSSVESRMFLVESISEVYEDSGETVKLIRGLRNGESQSYKLKSKLDGSGIKPGDAIRIITDSDGYINTVYREFSRKDNTLFVGNNTISGYREKANGAAYGPEQLYLYGIADKTQKGKNVFSQVGDSLRRLEYSSGKTKVYLFDENEETAKNVSFDDIEEGDVIYAHVHRSIVYEIVIYR